MIKRFFLCTIVLLLSLMSNGQIYFNLSGKINKKISPELPVGSEVTLTKIKYDKDAGYHKIYFKCNGKSYYSYHRDLKKITFEANNIQEFWVKEALNKGVYDNLMKKGMQYKLRKELEEEAIEYVKYTSSNNLLFGDSYLESYLYSLAYKLYPAKLNDGRPGILNVKIIKYVEPNAFIYANGTMFISTGLLSTINSEEELIAAMAHEIAHFVLDHSIININKAEQRKKRAEFWAGIATGVAFAADLYTASNNPYYTPGLLTLGTATIAYSVAEEFNTRMGLKYSREQEEEADACAKNVLNYIGVDHTSLSSVLAKIKTYNKINGNYIALTGSGTHPSIKKRIEAIGKPKKEFTDIEYDKTISFVNSFNAAVQLNNLHLEACSLLVDRNIKAGIATEEDYVILAMVTTFMFDNPKKNLEALGYITKAKSLNVYPTINLHKQEAIIFIRLKKYDSAKASLKIYLNSISELIEKENNDYLIKEEKWTRKMIFKVGKM